MDTYFSSPRICFEENRELFDTANPTLRNLLCLSFITGLVFFFYVGRLMPGQEHSLKGSKSAINCNLWYSSKPPVQSIPNTYYPPICRFTRTLNICRRFIYDTELKVQTLHGKGDIMPAYSCQQFHTVVSVQWSWHVIGTYNNYFKEKRIKWYAFYFNSYIIGYRISANLTEHLRRSFFFHKNLILKQQIVVP